MTLDYAHFTPGASAAGGVLIGLAAAVLVLGSGRILGAAGLFAGIVNGSREAWRLWWLAGLIGAGLVAHFGLGVPPPRFALAVPTLALAGFLVGFGARLGNGCTSGHGVCGLARLSPRSALATATFMAAGFAVVYVVRHLLG